MILQTFSKEWWMAMLHVRSTPRRAVFLEAGYTRSWEWGSGKRDIALTIALVCTLLFTAVFVGGPLTKLR